jgi:hypothetical protein
MSWGLFEVGIPGAVCQGNAGGIHGGSMDFTCVNLTPGASYYVTVKAGLSSGASGTFSWEVVIIEP